MSYPGGETIQMLYEDIWYVQKIIHLNKCFILRDIHRCIEIIPYKLFERRSAAVLVVSLKLDFFVNHGASYVSDPAA